MFSPSLISMMLHSFGPEQREAFGSPTPRGKPSSFPDLGDLAGSLLKATSLPGSFPKVPVAGRTSRPQSKLEQFIANLVTFRLLEERGLLFFWGRIPLDVLVKLFAGAHQYAAEIEYVDLGTPVHEAGSQSQYGQDCAKFLKLTADPPGLAGGTPAKVGAAIIDMGDLDLTATPDNYGSKLRHAVTSGVKMSDHAEKVLSVLLERMQTKKVLGDATISCALVKKPDPYIVMGRSCFDQACAPEIIEAATALEPILAGDGIPVAINMSLGTHVGPHNGMSPLEEYLAGTITTKTRFLVVAAGNEGGKGWAAKRSLTKDDPEFLGLHTGRMCEEVLVEFWWDDATPKDLSIEAEIYETLNGQKTHHGTLPINPKTAGAVLTTVPIGLPGSMTTQSLFQAKLHKDFRCIAFAMSSGTPGVSLPALQIRFKLTAALKDVVVNSWIVVAEQQNPLTVFVEGGPECSIAVPASDLTTLSVAGLQASGQIWEGSSRGPAAQYDTKTASGSPLMAHLANLGSELGTSFASPRACADVVQTLNDPAKQPRCVDAMSLLSETYPLPGGRPWSPRFGYHKQKL
jgi:hypothetical protein